MALRDCDYCRYNRNDVCDMVDSALYGEFIENTDGTCSKYEKAIIEVQPKQDDQADALMNNEYLYVPSLINNAIWTIKGYCNKHRMCSECGLVNEDGKCLVRGVPCDWNVG